MKKPIIWYDGIIKRAGNIIGHAGPGIVFVRGENKSLYEVPTGWIISYLSPPLSLNCMGGPIVY